MNTKLPLDSVWSRWLNDNENIGENMLLQLLAQTTQSSCELNGQPIDCGELVDKITTFFGMGLAVFALVAIIVTVVSLLVFIFWLLMLLHALNHDSPDRKMWIVILSVSFIFGFALIAAAIYFFAEKKKADQYPQKTNPIPTTDHSQEIIATTENQKDIDQKQ